MMHMYTVFILITSLVGTIRSFSNYSNDDMSPFHHFSSSNDFLFVGGKRGITVLDKKNLNPTFEKEVGEVWLVLYNKLKNNIILCSKNDTIDTSSCRLLDTTTLASVGSEHSPMEINITITNLPVYVQTQVDTTDDVIVIGATSFQIKKSNENIWVADYSIVTLNTTDLNIFDTPNIKGPMNLERGPLYDIVFKSTIATDSFVFFFLQICNGGTFIKSRVGKLCKKTKGDAKNNGDYHSYEDIGITCMVNGSKFDMVERAVLVDNKTFIVILRNSQGHNAVCTYSVDAVLNQMTSARKSTLDCGNFVKGSYFKPNLTVNDAQCFKSKHCNGGEEFCGHASGSFCPANLYSTIWDGYAIQSNHSFYANEKKITALASHSSNVSESSIIIIGTETGNLILINVAFLKDDAMVSKSEIKESAITNSSIKEILVDDSTGIFIMTNEKIIRITGEECRKLYSCGALCKINPFCDWISESSYKLFRFPGSTLITESDSNEQLNITPNSIFIGEGMEQIKFTGITLPSANITCSILGLNVTWGRPTNVSCNFTKTKDIQPGNYTFSLFVNYDNVANTTIEFFSCSKFERCQMCADIPGCNWNHYEGKCKRQDYSQYTNITCPRIRSSDQTLIYANKENVTMYVTFLNDSKPVPNELLCEASNGTFKTCARGVVSQHSFMVTCYNFNFTDHGQELFQNTLFNLTLRYWNGTYIDGHKEIEVYTCRSNISSDDECARCKEQEYPTKCYWCQEKCYSSEEITTQSCQLVSNTTCRVHLLDVSPSNGPVNGSTLVSLFGNNFIADTNNISVHFNQSECFNLSSTYNQSNHQYRLTCLTPSVQLPSKIYNISVSVYGDLFPQNNDNGWYEYKEPSLTRFFPTKSIQSGGRPITIVGNNIGFYGHDRYRVDFCGNSECTECRDVRVFNGSAIQCRSGNVSSPAKYGRLEVVIDDRTLLYLNNQSLVYVEDPSGFELSNETASVQQSGGAKITINGAGFKEVGKVTIENVDKPCDIASDTLVECETPKYKGNGSLTGKVTQTVNVYFDGLTVQITINYVGDPKFERYTEVLEYEKGSSINIKGERILAGARWNDYTIYIGKTGLCYTEEKHVSNINIECWPPQHVPLTNYSDKNLVYIHLKVGRIRVHLGELRYVEETNHLVIVTSVLAAALVIAVAVGTGVILTMRKKRKKAEKKFMIELQSVEERIRTNSREEFAEMQIAIGDIQSDLVTSKVPYRGYQTYILMLLFPNQDPDTNSLLLNLEVSDRKDDNYTQAVEKLELLMQNKLFLRSLVQTLDKSNTLTAKEKAQFAALISVAMLGKMRLFYDLVNCLLTDTIRSVTKKQQRSLFRRLDSITCRMMTHFLQIVMYKQLQGQTGMQLFLLLKSVQTVMENGPVDAVTGHCKNTLCEEKLLKLRVDSEQHTLNIDLNGNSDHRYQVKVLECDTISQVKRKCCYQIYKNTPASEIPKFEELELEWNEGQAGRLLLQDIDQTSERTDGHLRLNTLSHYNVKHDCRMSLMYGIHEDEVYENTTRQSECASSEDVNLLIPDTMEGYDNLVKWHLSMSHFEEGPNPERDFGDIYLNRLFHTKLLLSKYIDSMFEGLLDSKLVSLPISYFIQTLEKLGKESMVDPDVIQIWKNECYGTRLWAPMIAKPQAAFDIHVPQYVEPVMDVLSHVFVESVTQTHSKVNKESPTHRLMFHKDVERYRRLIDTFYSYMEPVADHDFWKVLDQLSDMQKEQVKLSRQSTIHQLYNLFIARHKDKILMDFEDMEESRSLQFGQKLEEIFDLMEEQ